MSDEERITPPDPSAGPSSATSAPPSFVLSVTAAGRRRVVATAVAVGLLLAAANLPVADRLGEGDPSTIRGQAGRVLYAQLDLSSEVNLATWWSSMLLALTALLAIVVGVGQRPAGLRRWAWWLVAGLLVVLSADEVAHVHESLARTLDATRAPGAQIRVGAGDWIPILSPAIAVAAVGLVAFALVLLRGRRQAQICTIAAVGLWLFSILFEAIEGDLVPIELGPHLRELLEEGCELVGTTLLLAAFLEVVVSPEPLPSLPGDPIVIT